MHTWDNRQLLVWAYLLRTCQNRMGRLLGASEHVLTSAVGDGQGFEQLEWVSTLRAGMNVLTIFPFTFTGLKILAWIEGKSMSPGGVVK